MGDYVQTRSQVEADNRRLRIERAALHQALALARSMILSGERMSPQAEAIINGALVFDGDGS